MNAKVFVDTNVLLYVKDRTSPTKRKAAQAWLAALAAQSAGVISRQTLREYYNVATKPKNGFARAETRREVEALRAWLPPDGGWERLQDAWDIQDRYQLEFFDCLLLASARAAGCSHFLSEDMHPGLDVVGTCIVHFIATQPEDILL